MRQIQITAAITNRDTQSLEVYFNEIGKSGLITADEEVALGAKDQERG